MLLIAFLIYFKLNPEGIAIEASSTIAAISTKSITATAITATKQPFNADYLY